MRRNIYAFFASFIVCFSAYGQTTAPNIIDELNAIKSGQGEIRIFQDESLQGAIAMPRVNNLDENGNIIVTQQVKLRVYKIQVFSGNNQSKSKQEALSKQSTIRAAFPDIPSVISSDPPVWRLRVGNFDTNEEAQEMMKELKAKFPAFGREMYIVTEKNKQAAK